MVSIEKWTRAKPLSVFLENPRKKRDSVSKYHVLGPTLPIDLKIDNLDRVSIPTKIVATFDVEHPIHGTTYGV